MRTFTVLLLALSSFAIMIAELPAVEAQSTTDHQPYAFAFTIGEVVQHDNDWWEIDARLENRHCEDGNIYPWYRLSRPFKGSTEYRWVWAVQVDGDNGESGSAASTEGGDDPPPPCPQPPCFQGENP